MLTAAKLTITPDAAEVLAEGVELPPWLGNWPHKLRAAWCLDEMRNKAREGVPASVILRAASLVAERFERGP